MRMFLIFSRIFITYRRFECKYNEFVARKQMFSCKSTKIHKMDKNLVSPKLLELGNVKKGGFLLAFHSCIRTFAA